MSAPELQPQHILERSTARADAPAALPAPHSRPRRHRAIFTVAEWALLIASVEEHLRSYTEADYTWWEPDDTLPRRLPALLEKLSHLPRERLVLASRVRKVVGTA